MDSGPNPKSRMISSHNPQPVTSAKNLLQMRPHCEVPGGHEFQGTLFNSLEPPPQSPGCQPFSLSCFALKRLATLLPGPRVSCTSSSKSCSPRHCCFLQEEGSDEAEPECRELEGGEAEGREAQAAGRSGGWSHIRSERGGSGTGAAERGSVTRSTGCREARTWREGQTGGEGAGRGTAGRSREGGGCLSGSCCVLRVTPEEEVVVRRGWPSGGWWV